VKQILVVDDDLQIRELLSDVLQESYGVTLAANGREALVWIRQYPPDAIILDMRMPVMDGETFLLERRKQPACASVPVMVVSAEPRACQEGRRLGAEACIPKPFDVDVLLLGLASLLHRGTDPRSTDLT